MYATLSRVMGLYPFGPVVRPEHRPGTSVTHFVSSWTGLTQQHKFEVRWCILLFFLNSSLSYLCSRCCCVVLSVERDPRVVANKTSARI
jgi:hypothetical protein